MTTLVALLVLGALFAVFALLGPAERSKPCGGQDADDSTCDLCPLGQESGRVESCPLDSESR